MLEHKLNVSTKLQITLHEPWKTWQQPTLLTLACRPICIFEHKPHNSVMLHKLQKIRH